MPTEQIVNRVYQGPYLENEKPVEIPSPDQAPAEYGAEPGQAEAPIDWSQTSPDHVKGIIEGVPSESFPVVDPQFNAEQALIQDLIRQAVINSESENSEFDDFKKQVIAAFKHLGLDTRKFFPE